MKIKSSIKGRPKKKEPRNLQYWVEILHLEATLESDPFILAAIYSVFCGTASKDLESALLKEAGERRKEHEKCEERLGVRSRVQKQREQDD